ncbi:MAG: hypothetical protein PF442_13360 [Desulfobulbaceae bacterium]|jgi:hypothetical protein|nr:hypothetical protein [Desulfobulbaceae bacterium]
MSSRNYMAPDVTPLFAYHGLVDFDAWWDLEIPLVDALNHRGNGWSGVAFSSLTAADGSTTSFYIKCQENYNQHTLSHPFLGVPTFQKEFANIQLLISLGVPTLTPLYFAVRKVNGKHQAILVTLALTGYESLDGDFTSRLAPEVQQKVMRRCGQVSRKLNDAGYIHDCLYPKHLFYRYADTGVDVRLIDIEKLKWRPWKKRLMYREIERFIRRRGGLSDANLHHFLEAYFVSGQVDLSGTALALKLRSKV